MKEAHGPLRLPAIVGLLLTFYLPTAPAEADAQPLAVSSKIDLIVGAFAGPTSNMFDQQTDSQLNTTNPLGVTLILTPIIANCVSARHCRES